MPKRTSTYRTWYDNWERLIQYQSVHGNCNVPVDYAKDLRLGTWVQKQRERANTKQLTEVRVLALNSIGFEWAGDFEQDKGRSMAPLQELLCSNNATQNDKAKGTGSI